jgi:hypothetical protein
MTDTETGNAEDQAPEKVKKTRAKKEPAAPKEKKERTVATYPGSTKIYFGKDKDGRLWSPTNSPRRAGTKLADRWHYRNGMTLRQAVDAGMLAGDIVWDLYKGYIKFADPVDA